MDAQVAAHATAAGPPAARLRLLVVDDDEMDRHMVRHAVLRSGIGAAVDEARTSDEALHCIATGPAYDCIFLDYNLPAANGLTVLRRILGASPNVPVVMLTGQGDEEVAVALMKAGAVDYLPKSAATAERIAATVRYALELARANEMARRAHEDLRESVAHATAAAERTAHLQRITAALANADTLGAVAEVVAREAIQPLGAYAGCIALRSDDELVLMASVGYPDAACMGRGQRWPLASAIPIAEASRTGETVFVPSPEAWSVRYGGGHVPTATGTSRSRAWAALPLRGSAGAEGAILWTFDAAREFSADDRSLFLAISQQCTQALERARLREAERAARAEAERANQAKADFLARMSHDLRTPLNAIGGFTDLVLLGLHGPVTDAQRDALGRVRRAQEHLLTLINDILSFARLEAGQMELTLEPVPVADVLQQVRALIEPQAVAKRLRLEWVEGPLDVRVRADAKRLQQVLLNLTGNAVKFTDTGVVSLGWTATGGRVRIEVRDTGPGIPEEQQDHIFEPFVQGATHVRAPSSGVGLGLAISRELSRMMGGALSLTSRMGEGSVFSLELDRA